MKWIAVSFALLVAAIGVLASLGADSFVFRWSKAVPRGDMVAHFLLIGMLALLINCAFRTRRVRFGPVAMHRATIVVAALVTIEECSQLWVPNRSFSLSDLAANWAGIVVFGEMVLRVVRWSLRRSEPVTDRWKPAH